MCMAEVLLFAVKSGLQTSVCLKATNTMKEPLMLMLEDLHKVTHALWKTQVSPSEPLSLLASSAERSQQISDGLMFVFSLACANQLSLSHDWNIYCEVQLNRLLKFWIKIWIYNRTLFKVSVQSDLWLDVCLGFADYHWKGTEATTMARAAEKCTMTSFYISFFFFSHIS